ncbi:MAG: hypothetical protein LDL06_04050 [Candidatus Nitrosotenuis sp.]|nr:hypothetical protein [Candidatus Nitrosotenuis sp.]
MTSAITPPDSWRLRSDDSVLVLDGDWGFPLKRISEEPYEMYAYEVKNFPELIKVGIAKNSKKRLEEYYGRLLWQKSFNRRTAGMVEYLFMHSTYHRAHSLPPRWNVGNFSYETALPVLRNFFDSVGHESRGITEVRKMTVDEAEGTIDYIHNLLINEGVFEAISACGIRTFNGTPGIRSTITIKRGLTWNSVILG